MEGTTEGERGMEGGRERGRMKKWLSHKNKM